MFVPQHNDFSYVALPIYTGAYAHIAGLNNTEIILQKEHQTWEKRKTMTTALLQTQLPM